MAEGLSPAHEKQRDKRRKAMERGFGAVSGLWIKEARMAESTRSMRKAILDRDILPAWKNRLLTEVTPDDLRQLCAKVKERGAPATAIHARDIVKQIYAFAILHGEKVPNSADEVGPASIATFQPKDRALSPAEIKIMLQQIEHVPTLPTIRLNSYWIEKCLAHEDGRSSRGVYNKAEYEPQRRHMLQEWADMIDAWVIPASPFKGSPV